MCLYICCTGTRRRRRSRKSADWTTGTRFVGMGRRDRRSLRPELQQKAIAAVLKTLSPETLTLPEDAAEGASAEASGVSEYKGVAALGDGAYVRPHCGGGGGGGPYAVSAVGPGAGFAASAISHAGAEGSVAAGGAGGGVEGDGGEARGWHTMSSEVERAVEFQAMEAMFGLAVNPAASSQARAIARSHIMDVYKEMTTGAPLADTAEAIHRAALIERMNEFQRAPEKFVPAKPIDAPPGMPIGDDEVM